MQERNYRTISILLNSGPVYDYLIEELKQSELEVSKNTINLVYSSVISFVMGSQDQNYINLSIEEFAYSLLTKNEWGGFNDIDLCKMRAKSIFDAMINITIDILTSAVPDYDSLKYNGDQDFTFEIMNERDLKLSLRIYDKL